MRSDVDTTQPAKRALGLAGVGMIVLGSYLLWRIAWLSLIHI